MKTVAAMMMGFALGAVGLDQMTGQLRLTFGFTPLLSGFDFLIAVIGLFGILAILLTMEEGLTFKGRTAKMNLRVVFQTWAELPKYWMTSICSSVIGCWMGITPSGATPASFMSYGIAKRMSRRGNNVGNGEIGKASSLPKLRRMPQAPPHSCRCLRSASPARRRQRSCLADC